MPTELIPTYHELHRPYDYIPRSLPRPIHTPFPPVASLTPFPPQPGFSHIPPTGPARALDCVPTQVGPGRCLPNGLKNPWAPYSGATYAPSSLKVDNMARSLGGSMAGSIVHPTVYGGSLSGSVYSATRLRGLREDDGWSGSQGRIHRGLEPDMTSTAGAIPPVMSCTSWLHAASSPANSARLSPSSPEVYGQPPVDVGHPRRMSVSSVQIQNSFDCRPRQRRDNQQWSQADVPPSAAGGTGPYRRLTGSPTRGSPLRLADEVGSSGQVSVRSRRASTPARRCGECVA